MKNTIQENLKKYLLNKTKGSHELDNETLQKIVDGFYYESKGYSEEDLNNMTYEEFVEFLEFELDIHINIFETNFNYLAWCYEDESIYRVLQDISDYEDINTLVESQFNDDTYQFKNGLIINLMM